MKKQIVLETVVVAALILLLSACQKEAKNNLSKKVFDPEAAKEWYYALFKKSAVYRSVNPASSGLKLPDWKKGVSKKLGTYEVVDFPLFKQKFSVPVFNATGLSEENKKRIAEASVYRLAFIKDGKGALFVRQLSFIPDFGYLQQKGFDISSNSFADVDKNYSGLMIVQKWNGEYVSINRIVNGKISKRYNVNDPGTRNNIINCNGTLVTEYFRDCEVHIYGDGMVTESCGSWMPTGNEWCYEEDPDADPCEDPESPQCACQEYGLCEGGDDPNSQCNMDCAEAENMLNSVQTTVVTNGGFSTEAESGPDANGIIRKPVVIHRDGVENSYGLGYSDRYELFFNGVLYKTNTTSTQWKWESISYDDVRRVSGSAPPCLSNSTTASVSGPVISSDKLTASYSAVITTTISAPCLGGLVIDTKTSSPANTYHASSF